MIPVDYSSQQSIISALTGVDVVISTISATALAVQGDIAKAAKEARVKLFVPSEFGNTTEGLTEGLFGQKANLQDQLKALGLPYALFYTGPFADFVWASYASCYPYSAVRRVNLSSKVPVPRCHERESVGWW